MKKIICALLGHSKIITQCFGYIHCARCEEQIGDNLAGAFDATDTVIVHHECDTCKTNYKKLGWKHKIFTPYPFKKVNQ